MPHMGSSSVVVGLRSARFDAIKSLLLLDDGLGGVHQCRIRRRSMQVLVGPRPGVLCTPSTLVQVFLHMGFLLYSYRELSGKFRLNNVIIFFVLVLSSY